MFLRKIHYALLLFLQKIRYLWRLKHSFNLVCCSTSFWGKNGNMSTLEISASISWDKTLWADWNWRKQTGLKEKIECKEFWGHKRSFEEDSSCQNRFGFWLRKTYGAIRSFLMRALNLIRQFSKNLLLFSAFEIALTHGWSIGLGPKAWGRLGFLLRLICFGLYRCLDCYFHLEIIHWAFDLGAFMIIYLLIPSLCLVLFFIRSLWSISSQFCDWFCMRLASQKVSGLSYRTSITALRKLQLFVQHESCSILFSKFYS